MNRLICKCLLLCLITAFGVLGAPYEKLSSFEKEVTQQALDKYGLEIDKNPENKKIRRFYYYTEDPFKKSDKSLSWLNYLQFKTKDAALANQLWIHPGEIYNTSILIQNEQALLNPLVRSFALIFPVQVSKNPSNTEVDLLIVTKDVFNWQGNSYASAAGTTLGQLSLSFSQTNLFGMNKTLGANFILNQALMNPSLTYFDPALFSTKNQLTITQGVFWNRNNLGYEGVNGSFLLTYPLVTENTLWGYTAALAYTHQPIYDYQGSNIRLYEGYKRQYRTLQIAPRLYGTRSFGKTEKHNLSFGYGANLYKNDPLEAVPESFIQKVLPVSEFQSFLILGYQYFQNHFLDLRDYNTFAMTEWIQLGPSFSLINYVGLNPILGSDYTFWRPQISLGASASPSKTSFVSVSASGQTRIQDTLFNNQISTNITVVFPTLFHFGRFVLSNTYSKLWDNKNNAFFSLGGEIGLRGVPYRYYQGTQFLRSNLEFRTRSVPFWIFRLGLAAFYDFGNAFNDSNDFNPTHDFGLGVRILTIPWNRLLIRIDAATPVWGPIRGLSNTLITLGVGQAF